MDGGNPQQVVPGTIIDVHGKPNPVQIRPHTVDTRFCPTTKDADWCRRVTHEVITPGLGQIFRGTYNECVQFILDRQTAEATQAIAASLQNPCPMCRYYTVPGFIINAWQIVPCFQCNPGNCKNLPVPKELSETVEGQARES